MEADPSSKTNAFHRAKRRIKLRPYLLATLAIILASYDLWGAVNLTSAEPDDAKGYSQIAKNVLRRRSVLHRIGPAIHAEAYSPTGISIANRRYLCRFRRR